MSIRDAIPPEGYPIEYATLIAALQDGTREWIAEIGEPSEEAIIWQPWPKGSSIGAQVLHIASVEVGWLQYFCLGKQKTPEQKLLFMDAEIDVDAGIWPTPPHQPWAWYLDLLAEVRQQTLEAIKEYPEPSTVVPNRDSDITYRWVLAHVVQHESYHFGQAVLLSTMYDKFVESGQ